MRPGTKTWVFAASAAGLGFFTGVVVARTASPTTVPATHVDEEHVAWGGNPELPLVRWKTLIGGADGIPRADVQFGTFELGPKAVYPGHLHPAPELYLVLQGHATWTVGEETFEAGPGTAIYTPPGTVHRMVNASDEVVRAVWAWWAPGGDRSVLENGYRFVEPLPRTPR